METRLIDLKVYLFSLFASISFRDFQGFLDFASIKFRDVSQIAKTRKNRKI